MIKPWRNALGTKSGADFGTDRLKYFGYNITGRCNLQKHIQKQFSQNIEM